jgi:hypothetical protein
LRHETIHQEHGQPSVENGSKSRTGKKGIQPETVELGVVEIKGKISETQYIKLKETLSKYDLKIIKDKSELIIERVKTVIIEIVHFPEELPNIKYSQMK